MPFARRSTDGDDTTSANQDADDRTAVQQLLSGLITVNNGVVSTGIQLNIAAHKRVALDMPERPSLIADVQLPHVRLLSHAWPFVAERMLTVYICAFRVCRLESRSSTVLRGSASMSVCRI